MKVLALVLCFVLFGIPGFGKEVAQANDDVYDTVIVGGGIAGLTAAYKLKKKNILLLEKWPNVGGRVWEGIYKGFSYARGAEYLGEPWGVMKKMIKEYKLNPIQILSPAICHFNPNVPGFADEIWNGYYGIALMHVAEDGYDAKALDTYNRFQRETTEFVDLTYDAGELPHWWDTDHPANIYDWVTAREWFDSRGFGLTYIDKWNSHARGLYGANMDEVSILMMISELGWEYYEEDDIEMPDESWNEYQQGQYDTETYTFFNGLSEIPDAIAADKKLQGKIKTDSVVTEVRKIKNGNNKKKKDRYRIEYKDRITGEEFAVNAKSVVMATPADIALEIAPVIENKKREIMEQIEYCEYLTVNLFSEEPIQECAFELSTPDSFWVISFYNSLYVQKIENPDNPLNDEVFITTAYIAGRTCDEALVSLSDGEILSRTYDDLEKIYPGSSSKIQEWQINRFTRGYPVMGLGAYQRITRLNQLNDKSKTFKLVGDYMALPTMEAAMSQAEHAVKKLKVK